jgi:hypothetical protein
VFFFRPPVIGGLFVCGLVFRCTNKKTQPAMSNITPEVILLMIIVGSAGPLASVLTDVYRDRNMLKAVRAGRVSQAQELPLFNAAETRADKADAWIKLAANKIHQNYFRPLKMTMPERISVTFGVPDNWIARKLRPNKPAPELRGECAYNKGLCRILINPNASESFEVLEVLMHMMIHAALRSRCMDGHNDDFNKVAYEVGLPQIHDHIRRNFYNVGNRPLEKSSRLGKEFKSLLIELGPMRPKGLK